MLNGGGGGVMNFYGAYDQGLLLLKAHIMQKHLKDRYLCCVDPLITDFSVVTGTQRYKNVLIKERRYLMIKF